MQSSPLPYQLKSHNVAPYFKQRSSVSVLAAAKNNPMEISQPKSKLLEAKQVCMMKT
jgi:hypothetical protein